MTMTRSLVSRLDRHLSKAAALAAALAAAGGISRSAEATIVYSGIVNINIPSTFAGVYLNVVTGVHDPATANVPGWDLGPWNATDLDMFAPVTAPGNVGGHVGGATTYFNLTPGTLISSASTFSGNGTATIDASTPLNFNSSNNLVGFRFYNETTTQVHYGWMRIALSGAPAAQPRTIVEYAYEDAPGAQIAAGDTVSNPNFGSCCFASGVCTAMLAADCTAQGGTPGAVGSTCAAANCATRCCMPDGTCQMLAPPACASAGGVSTANADCGTTCPQPGACCLGDGTCTAGLPAACTASNGAYQGAGTTCAAISCSGACCRNDGTCSITGANGCATVGNIVATFSGAGTTCASAQCARYTVVNNIPGTFTDITATGTAFSGLASGSLDDGTYAFTSSVTNALVATPSLFVGTNGDITNLQTFTAYINSTIPNATAGLSFALYAMWDDLDNNTPSVLLHQATVENSVPVEIIQWNTFHHGTTNGNGMLQAKIFAPGGPALVQYLYQDLTWNWNGNSATIGVQWSATNAFQFSYGANNAAGGPIPNNAVLSVVGTATGPTCYANCDQSTAVPFLNVQDFTCFLQKFASANAYANCDNSTTAPTLNVQDFTCFLQKFAAGCSAP